MEQHSITSTDGGDMTWHSILMNPASLLAIYGGPPPPLDQTSIHEVNVHRDGPCLTLRFDLPQFPNRPPSKWAARGFNTVQVKLSFFGLQELQLEGFSTNVMASIDLRKEDLVTVDATSPTFQLKATALSVDVVDISAYADES